MTAVSGFIRKLSSPGRSLPRQQMRPQERNNHRPHHEHQTFVTPCKPEAQAKGLFIGSFCRVFSWGLRQICSSGLRRPFDLTFARPFHQPFVRTWPFACASGLHLMKLIWRCHMRASAFLGFDVAHSSHVIAQKVADRHSRLR